MGAPAGRGARVEQDRKMSIKYWLLFLLYFVQGIPYGLQSGLLPIYFRTVGLSFTKISLTKLLYLPWFFKVFWAPFVDWYFSKKTWLIFTMCGLALTCLACSFLTPEEDFLGVAIVLLLMNIFASVQDVAADGIAIQLLGPEEKLGFWNGIVATAFSIAGSSLGGQLMSEGRDSDSLQTLLVLRFGNLLFQTWVILTYTDHAAAFEVAAVLSMCIQHFIGGQITTL
ncbi:hypothetical protein E2320_011839, partial [Naja naja]